MSVPPEALPGANPGDPALDAGAGAVTPSPPGTPEEKEQRKGAWLEFFRRLRDEPQLNSMVLQLGTQLAQPVPLGQTRAGHVGRAIGAADIAGRSAEEQQKNRQLQEDTLGVRRERQGMVEREGAANRATRIGIAREQSRLGERRATEAGAQRERIARTASEESATRERAAERRFEVQMQRMQDTADRQAANSTERQTILDRRNDLLERQLENEAGRRGVEHRADIYKAALDAGTDEFTGAVDVKKVMDTYRLGVGLTTDEDFEPPEGALGITFESALANAQANQKKAGMSDAQVGATLLRLFPERREDIETIFSQVGGRGGRGGRELVSPPPAGGVREDLPATLDEALVQEQGRVAERKAARAKRPEPVKDEFREMLLRADRAVQSGNTDAKAQALQELSTAFETEKNEGRRRAIFEFARELRE